MSVLSPLVCRAARDRMIQRVRGTLVSCDERFPYAAHPRTGVWSTTEDGDWAGGYWVALLLHTYQWTGDASFRRAARRFTKKMLVHWSRADMFRGLMFYLAGARAWQLTGDLWHKNLGVRAAKTMCSMFRPDIAAIPVGSELKVKQSGLRVGLMTAIDNVFICLLPLWWQWKENRSDTCRHIANAQLETTRRLLIREDGSTVQIAEWSEVVSAPVRRFSYQSCTDGGCWSRGQAFAIAGYCLAYEHTQDPRDLLTLSLLADYYEQHSPADAVPGYDLTLSPPPHTLRDTSAAAIVSYGITRLLQARVLPQTQADRFQRLRNRILQSLIERYLTPVGEGNGRPEGMLLEGCFNARDNVDTCNELIWGDYYLLESLAALVEHAN